MGVGVNFLILIPIVALPVLVQNGTISLLDEFLILEAIIFMLSYLVVALAKIRGKRGAKLKVGGFIFIFLSVIVLTLAYLTSAKTPPNWFLLLIPVDFVILAIPLYLYSVNRREPNLSNSVFSEKYTSILNELFSESLEEGHEVYLSSIGNRRSYASTTNGKRWKIRLSANSTDDLTEGEIRMLLAETYISRKKGTALKLASLSAGLVALYLDLLIAMPLLKDMLPSLSTLFLAVAMASFVLLFSLPFYILALFTHSTIRTDTVVVERFGSGNELKELIRKNSDLRVPPPTLTERQLKRYNSRLQKNLTRRIESINRLES